MALATALRFNNTLQELILLALGEGWDSWRLSEEIVD